MTPPLPPLSPWQQFVWDHDKHWLLFGGRRIGKSYVCSRKGVHYCINGKHTAWFCANRTLADENWNSVVEFCMPFATRVNKATLGIMEFENPEIGQIGTFKRKSAWGDTAGRAGTLDFAILDESQLLKKAIFNRIIPSLVTRRGRAALTLTAPETPEEFRQAQWIKEIIDTADDQGNSHDPRWKNWLIMKSPTRPEDIAFFIQQGDLAVGIKGRKWQYYLNLATESLEEDKALLGEADFNREFLLHWGLDTSMLVYGSLLDGVHRKAEFDFDPDFPVRWSMDRAEGLAINVLGFFQQRRAGEIKNVLHPNVPPIPVYAYRFFDEVSTRRVLSEDEMIELAIKRSEEMHYPMPEWAFYDPRAPGYRKAILDAGLRPYSCNVPIEGGIRTVLRCAGRKQLEIHPRCKVLWGNISDPTSGYIRDDKGDPVDDNNDGADMMRYGVYMSERLAGTVNSVAEENRQSVEQLTNYDTQAALLRL